MSAWPVGSRRKTAPFWLSLTKTLAVRRRHVAGMECAGDGRNAGLDAAAGVERDQRAALARLDRRHAGRAVGGDPQPLARCIPGDGERMQRRRQGGDRPAGRCGRRGSGGRGCSTPKWSAVAGNAFDQPMPGVDRQHRLRLRRPRPQRAPAGRSPKRPGDQLLQLGMDGRRAGDIFARARTPGRRRDNRSRTLPLP